MDRVGRGQAESPQNLGEASVLCEAFCDHPKHKEVFPFLSLWPHDGCNKQDLTLPGTTLGTYASESSYRRGHRGSERPHSQQVAPELPRLTLQQACLLTSTQVPQGQCIRFHLCLPSPELRVGLFWVPDKNLLNK